MDRVEKRSISIDVEDSGLGSNHHFPKYLKMEEESMSTNPWSFTFNDRNRAAFAVANKTNFSFNHVGNNENSCKLFSPVNSSLITNGINSLFTGKYSSRSRDGRVELKILVSFIEFTCKITNN